MMQGLSEVNSAIIKDARRFGRGIVHACGFAFLGETSEQTPLINVDTEQSNYKDHPTLFDTTTE
jgi:hypothetical protein